MNASSAILTYAACGLLIAVYAAGRFDTPSSNRSSTRRTLYRWARAGYVLSAAALFAVLSVLLQAAAWRTALLGPADAPSLPPPLIAALAMTTLLPSIPVLKRLDASLLAVFLDWAEIPAEVKRRAAAMTPESFSVSAEDVTALRAAYGEDSWGGDLGQRLRKRGSDGLALSEFRLTRAVKLHDRIHRLAGEPGYGRFFAEAETELSEIDRRMAEFLRHATEWLALAERLREVGNETAFSELVRERHEAFARSCRDIFQALTLLLARAVLRSEASEAAIVRRLREAGFAAAGPMSLPRFPIDSLTLLMAGMFLYLGVLILLLGGLVGMPRHGEASGLAVAAKAALVRPATIGVTLLLMQRHSFFRRGPGEPLRLFAYAVNGAAATAAAAALCLLLHLADLDPLAGVGADLPMILLTFPLCTAVALCCDDWVGEQPPPRWLRPVEAAGCAAVMAAGMAMVLIYLPDRLPFPAAGLSGRTIAMAVLFPASIALAIGGFVPHIYRAARRAAAARREEAGGPPAPAAGQTHDNARHASGAGRRSPREGPTQTAREAPGRANGSRLE